MDTAGLGRTQLAVFGHEAQDQLVGLRVFHLLHLHDELADVVVHHLTDDWLLQRAGGVRRAGRQEAAFQQGGQIVAVHGLHVIGQLVEQGDEHRALFVLVGHGPRPVGLGGGQGVDEGRPGIAELHRGHGRFGIGDHALHGVEEFEHGAGALHQYEVGAIGEV